MAAIEEKIATGRLIDGDFRSESRFSSHLSGTLLGLGFELSSSSFEITSFLTPKVSLALLGWFSRQDLRLEQAKPELIEVLWLPRLVDYQIRIPSWLHDATSSLTKGNTHQTQSRNIE
jgi:hypothetical protein